VTYDNYGSNVEIKGFEMMNNGLKIHLEGTLVSELLIYEVK